MGWLCTLNKKGKSKASSQIHPHSAVDRAANTILCTCRMKPRGLRWQGDRTARQEQLSDVHPATWPVQVTAPPHQSIHSHWTQLASWAAMDLPSLVGTLGPACIQASWELPGLQWLSPLCTLQLASLSLATPGGEPYWPSSVDTRLVKQVMLLFCTFISNTSKIPRYQEANEE